MLRIGHRGAKGHVAENTLASFQKALDLGVDMIELDVHRCASGEIIVLHDETLDRTTSGSGKVTDLTLSQLKMVSIEVEHQVPTLTEVLDLIHRKCVVNIELKGANTAKGTLDILATYIGEKGWQPTDFILSSFDWLALEEVHQLNPNIPIGVLTATDIDLAIGFAKFSKAVAIHPYYHLLTTETVAKMRENQFKIFPWTVNEPEDITFVKSLAVDGIISDYPERV
ncbi:glycerophosphodiester phosphodiesterase [Flavobacterium capsici]|uniref:Glycerophosphodiester phosphodiesterase family protein n=1 Tax=Flavobacterium capsici TaxID=3075618 RepID=A0AA96J392_9FLAO|nr:MULTISPECIES: glycerophosphodiester phosphodiesterase family protein [unclassified Flavobacterium]WNM19950.1 glycerophosphodiester phosphodiesterase family protein [Flavobacterium sp. PMR2A8]WNM21339.1 glycerophosphodiester phosphodiesterase family protein [Flavobacterium sp. PMTSA4]